MCCIACVGDDLDWLIYTIYGFFICANNYGIISDIWIDRVASRKEFEFLACAASILRCCLRNNVENHLYYLTKEWKTPRSCIYAQFIYALAFLSILVIRLLSVHMTKFWCLNIKFPSSFEVTLICKNQNCYRSNIYVYVYTYTCPTPFKLESRLSSYTRI